MGWLQTIVVVAVAVLGLGAWHWLRYPGTWKHSFGPEHQEDRNALDRRRVELRRARSASAQRRNAGAQKLARAERAYQQAVFRAEDRLRGLERETPGGRVTGLGRIALHEHVLRVFGEDGALDEHGRRAPADGPHADYALVGLTLECDSSCSASETYLTIRSRTASPVLVPYRSSEYPEHLVRQFALDVEAAVGRAHDARARKEQDIAQAKDQLDATRCATQGVDSARAGYEKVAEEEAKNPSIPRARAALDAERSAWEGRTGRRPLS